MVKLQVRKTLMKLPAQPSRLQRSRQNIERRRTPWQHGQDYQQIADMARGILKGICRETPRVDASQDSRRLPTGRQDMKTMQASRTTLCPSSRISTWVTLTEPYRVESLARPNLKSIVDLWACSMDHSITIQPDRIECFSTSTLLNPHKCPGYLQPLKTSHLSCCRTTNSNDRAAPMMQWVWQETRALKTSFPLLAVTAASEAPPRKSWSRVTILMGPALSAAVIVATWPVPSQHSPPIARAFLHRAATVTPSRLTMPSHLLGTCLRQDRSLARRAVLGWPRAICTWSLHFV